MIRLIVELGIKSKRNTREHLFRSASLARLLLLLGTAEAWWRRANLTGDARSIADVTVMDGRRDAVVLLQVDLGDGIVLVDGGLGEIAHGGRVDHVADHVLLDGLVLGDARRRVDAADVSAALLVASVISSLLGHFEQIRVSLLDNR